MPSTTVAMHPQEVAWAAGEAETIAAMGAINVATAQLVSAIGRLIDSDGWHGWGIQSVEHWVCWKADVSRHRATGLVQVARRRDELPVCWELFASGRLTEDAMVRIARKVPAARDREVAGWATAMTISQLTRLLGTLPELGARVESPVQPQDRHLRFATREDGWGYGTFRLPPDEMALVQTALSAGRDAEFRDRKGLAPDADIEGSNRVGVTWADALVRLSSEALDAMDAELRRTGRRGSRHQVVLHHEVGPLGELGPGQLHLGAHVPDAIARYLRCDADVMVALYTEGRLLGIAPTDRSPSRAVRRHLERRDGGCVHPLCEQKAWLHAHHLEFWEDGGLTTPSNLVCLCPRHHRALHQGDFTIAGDPEDRSLVFTDRHGHRIEPPVFGPPGPADVGTSTTTPAYRPPHGERLNPLWFSWN